MKQLNTSSTPTAGGPRNHPGAGALPRLLTLAGAAEILGPGISESSLRREVHAGRLKAVRARPGTTAKILIREDDLLDWLETHAASRQYVTKEVRKGERRVRDERSATPQRPGTRRSKKGKPAAEGPLMAAQVASGSPVRSHDFATQDSDLLNNSPGAPAAGTTTQPSRPGQQTKGGKQCR